MDKRSHVWTRLLAARAHGCARKAMLRVQATKCVSGIRMSASSQMTEPLQPGRPTLSLAESKEPISPTSALGGKWTLVVTEAHLP